MSQWGIEAITPTIAKKYLETNSDRQRTLNPKHVSLLVKEMLEDRWLFNGDPIRFNKQGILIDGQHRLHAVIKSGMTHQFFVIRGLDNSVMPTIDTGRKTRSSADLLYMAGEKSATRLGGALHFLIQYERGSFFTGSIISTQEVLECLRRHPEIRTSMWVAYTKWVKILIRPSIAIALHYLFSRIDQDLANQFFTTIETGETNRGIDAALVLRETLMEKKVINKRANTLLSRNYEPAITIKAWNAYIKGMVPKRYSYDQAREKTFPIINNAVVVEAA